jgi:hypothetical protein
MSILELLDKFSFNEILSYTDSRTESLIARTNKYFERFYFPCHLSKLDKYSLDDILSYTNNTSRRALRTINSRFKDLRIVPILQFNHPVRELIYNIIYPSHGSH